VSDERRAESREQKIGEQIPKIRDQNPKKGIFLSNIPRIFEYYGNIFNLLIYLGRV